MMEINQYTFIDYFKDFYPNYIPFMLFILCCLLFKNKPNKWAYIHLFIVIFIVIFKHWATMIDVIFDADDLGIEIDVKYVFYDYLNHAFFTALSVIAMLALLYRPNNINIGYDKVLKKEIWGVWYKENNSTEYFDKRERELQKELKDG